MKEARGLIIRRLREAKGLTQNDLASASGLSLSLIRGIEQDTRPNFTIDTLNALAGAFYLPVEKFIKILEGKDDSVHEAPAEYDPLAVIKERLENAELVNVPVKGYVNAGTPAVAEQQDLGTVAIPKSDLSGVKKVSGVFALRVSGDSLEGDGIQNGDTVLVDPEPAIIDGKIYIVKLGNECVARHLHREDGYVVLTSSNGKYQRIEAKELEVQGRIILAGNWRKY